MASKEQIEEIVSKQREYFATGKTIDVKFRKQKLKELYTAIKKREIDIERAIREDLGKSGFESYMCEVGLTLSEIKYQMKHVRRWAAEQYVDADFANFNSSYHTIAEPYGEVLVMSPWNYPFLLTMEPLAGAIAAGNCVVVKPSAYSPETSKIMASIIEQVFDAGHVACVQGGRDENTALLDQRWDYIFFTGSVAVGKLVMSKASENLTPVTLELGGKSPCVIAADANLKIAAGRLAFGKYLNLGQTCVAPDYVLVDEKVHDAFVAELKAAVEKMYGDALSNYNYGKIVNEKHFDRLMGLIDESKVVYGGKSNRETLQIEPTIMDGVTAEDAVMGQEIFGPICPIITYTTIAEAEAFIKEREKPLALYLFTNDKALQDHFQRCVPFGGGCINDTIVHLATSNMGFGGVGASGMGSYHGLHSFRTFSHQKSILVKHRFPDLQMRNQPYSKLKARLIKMFLG